MLALILGLSKGIVNLRVPVPSLFPITAIFWPPERQPIVVALYLTQTEASFSERNKAITEIGEAIVLTVDSGR